MNEKINQMKASVKGFVTNPNTKAVAKLVAEYAIIAALSIVITVGVRAAGNAINEKFFSPEIEEPVNLE